VSEMTYEEAAASISEAVKTDPEFTPGAPDPLEHPAQAAEAPAPADQEAAPTPEVETPAGEPSDFESPDSDSSFMDGDFNPDLLPVELQPGWKQLQGAFTRKTQELAEQRKTFEELGDPDALRQAQEFYQSLQDPQYLKDFYSELGNVVREMGLVEDDSPAAPEAPVETPQAELPAELKAIVDSDPELQPFVDRFAAMEQRLNSFEQQAQESAQAMENERLLMDQAAEIDRMVGAVREQHPEYNDDDWQAIYDRAVAFDGDVLKAADLFQADRDRIIAGYLEQKQVAPAAPLPGAGTVTEPTEEKALTLDEADKAAQAYLDANDLSEFSG
jgi:hypothetical protein